MPRYRIVVGLVLLAAGALPLAAQQPDSTKKDTTAVELPPIEVVGSILPAAGPTVGSGVPARVVTLNREQLEASEPRFLTDALVTQAGISSYDDLGASAKLTLSTRGFYASPVVGLPQGLSVFLDGIRQNEPDAAQVNFDLLPMEHLTRVEMLSGTASLLGRNSLGGAINLVTNSGGGPTRAEVEGSGGNFGTYGADGSVSGGFGAGKWSYYVGGGYDNEDGWRQDTGSEQYNGFFNLGRLNPTWGLRLQGYAAKSNVQAAGSLPESVYNTTPDSNLTTGDFENLDNLQLALFGYKRTGSGQFSASAYVRRHHADRFNVNQASDPDSRGTSRNRIVGASADYRWTKPISSGKLGLRIGADGSSSGTDVQLFADSTKLSGPSVQTTFVKSPTWDLAGYMIGDVTTGRVTFSGGARYDYVKIPFQNQLDPTRDTSSSYDHLSPRGGISVDAGSGISLYGSVGSSFRAPAVIELACADPNEPCPLPFSLGDDPPIKPVKALTYEIGGKAVAGNLLLSGSLYLTNVTDDIFLFASPNPVSGSTIDGYFGNLPKTRREGVELAAQLFLAGGHTLYANYSYTKATFQSSAVIFSVREDFGGDNTAEPGDELPLVPNHQLKGGGSFVLPHGFFCGADGRYIGTQWLRGDEANQTSKLDGYAVLDGRVGWRDRNWEITVIGNNVFQNQYASFGAFNVNQGAGNTLERFLTPGQRRQVRLVVRRSFGGASYEE
jgi:outer membrane receptor protein involved in Fe transport